MSHTIVDAHGERIEVLTMEDLEAYGDRQAARLLRWLIGAGITMASCIVGATLWVASVDHRQAATEQRVAAMATSAREDSHDLQALTRKVDSLTYVIGTQTEILREIRRAVR